ncbi:MAG: hypothetical protein ACI8ZM_001452 [Crocinitomix sp.]|jgi:hypothetical protein
MKKVFTIVAIVAVQFGIAQTTLTLQPDAEEGKDAFLDSRVSDYMGGDHFDFVACSWTHGGEPVDARAIVEFDLTAIPDWAIIESATLYLYGYNSPSNTGHASLGDGIGNNAYIQRITSNWSEETVSWDTQPSTTESNQIFLEGTLEEDLDYEVDVKTVLEDMILFPEEAFGFMLRLVNEETYNSLLFASSDNANAALRPKLVIVYDRDQQSNSIKETELKLSIYPNSNTQILQFKLEDNISTADIKIYSTSGVLVYCQTNLQLENGVNYSNWAKGIYILHFRSSDAILTRKFRIH